MPVELFVGAPGTQQPQMHDPDNPGSPKIQPRLDLALYYLRCPVYLV
jgi:hypothetical protein